MLSSFASLIRDIFVTCLFSNLFQESSKVDFAIATIAETESRSRQSCNPCDRLDHLETTDRKDRSDVRVAIATILAIVAITWKPGFTRSTFVMSFDFQFSKPWPAPVRCSKLSDRLPVFLFFGHLLMVLEFKKVSLKFVISHAYCLRAVCLNPAFSDRRIQTSSWA